MKITKKELESLIESYLKEQDLGFGDYIPGPDGKSMADDMDSFTDLANWKYVVDTIWSEMKSKPGKYHLPVYSFLRYLAGESSDMSEGEIKKTKNGAKYLLALTETLDNVALPNDGTYKGGNLKNGFAFQLNGKPICFYVLDYYGHWGRRGQGALVTEWLDALLEKGDIGRHWGPTLGKSGKGGRQIVESGLAEVMHRPDFKNGYHIINNEFDFVRSVSGVGTLPADKMASLFQDLISNLDQSSGVIGKLQAGLAWAVGRGLNTAQIVAGLSPTPFTFNFKVKSNIKNWPDITNYPVPNSLKSAVKDKVKGVELIPGQALAGKKEKKPYDKHLDGFEKGSPDTMKTSNPGEREASIRSAL